MNGFLELPIEAVNQLEPSALAPNLDPTIRHQVSQTHMLFSAAVSLKRIADALEPASIDHNTSSLSIAQALAGLIIAVNECCAICGSK